MKSENENFQGMEFWDQPGQLFKLNKKFEPQK